MLPCMTTAPRPRSSTPGPRASVSGADVHPGPVSAATLAARAERVVGVLGLGRLGLRVALGLQASGVGRLVLDDEATVRPTDVGLGGYTGRDVGRVRRLAAAQVVADAHAQARPSPASVQDIDLRTLDAVVVVTRTALEPERTWRLMGSGVPHMVLRWVGDDAVDVGPLVIPGRNACLRCLALHERDDPAARPPAPDGVAEEEPLLACAAAVVAVARVLARLDGRRAGMAVSTRLRLPDARAQEDRWPVHPDCGCTGQVRDAGALSAPGRVTDASVGARRPRGS